MRSGDATVTLAAMTGRLLCRLRIHRWRVQRNAENVVFSECSRCGKLWEEVMAMKYRPM